MRKIVVQNDFRPTPIDISEGERQAIIHGLKERILFLRKILEEHKKSPYIDTQSLVAYATTDLRDAVSALDVFVQNHDEVRV